MTESPGSSRPVLVAFAGWALAFALSLYLAAGTEPIGDGFTRGLNRVGTFFRWQFLAFALAIITWMTGRGRADLTRGVRMLSRAPITIQCLLGLVGVAIVVLALVLD